MLSPYTKTDADNQTLSLSGTNLTISGGNNEKFNTGSRIMFIMFIVLLWQIINTPVMDIKYTVNIIL